MLTTTVMTSEQYDYDGICKVRTINVYMPERTLVTSNTLNYYHICTATETTIWNDIPDMSECHMWIIKTRRRFYSVRQYMLLTRQYLLIYHQPRHHSHHLFLEDPHPNKIGRTSQVFEMISKTSSRVTSKD